MSEFTRTIRCSCCGRVKMAERDDEGRIRIVRRSHGEYHEVVVDPKENGDNTNEAENKGRVLI